MAVHLDDLSLENLAGFFYPQAEVERDSPEVSSGGA